MKLAKTTDSETIHVRVKLFSPLSESKKDEIENHSSQIIRDSGPILANLARMRKLLKFAGRIHRVARFPSNSGSETQNLAGQRKRFVGITLRNRKQF